MSASFYDLLKYAKTGIASSDMTAYDKMRAVAMCGGKIKTLTGVPPLSFRANGKPLISWDISGNAVQNGTPAPDAPVDVQGCGEKTKNLLDNQMQAEVNHRGVKYTKNSDASVKMFGATSSQVSYCILMGDGAATNDIGKNTIPIFKAGEQIVFSTGTTELLQIRFTDGSYGNAQDVLPNVPVTVRKDIGLVYVQVNSNKSINKTIYPMIRRADISDSTYEPYGYYLPITCAGQTTPIYLGQTQSTRRIKKLVLTGKETGWQTSVVYPGGFFISWSSLGGVSASPARCSHAYGVPITPSYVYGTFFSDATNFNIRIMQPGTLLTEWKQWLAAQYSSGTPVTIWYVLATPTTGIVNEPLMKIGTYADELHSTDAAVTIPTARGSNTLTVDTTVQPSIMTITYR